MVVVGGMGNLGIILVRVHSFLFRAGLVLVGGAGVGKVY